MTAYLLVGVVNIYRHRFRSTYTAQLYRVLHPRRGERFQERLYIWNGKYSETTLIYTVSNVFHGASGIMLRSSERPMLLLCIDFEDE